MQKLKSINWSGFLNIIKCCMIGILITLIGLIVFAVILKFADLSSNLIGYINDVIKAVSIFVMILCIKKTNGDKLIVKSFFAGLLYAILSLIVFAILNKGFSFNMTILYDILFALIVSIIASIIINLLYKKNL